MLTSVAWSKAGHATTARAVSLHDLVTRSSRVLRGTPLEGVARSEDIGGARHIVTYSRVRVEDLIQGGPAESEILVRTLGGRMGNLVELVHGEAELALNEACVVFVHQNTDGTEGVTAMAQGHFPIANDASGTPRLRASQNMAHLVGGEQPAATLLAGARLEEARSLILGVRR
jgi:hypothetical protein